MSKADGSIIIDTKIDQSGLEKGLNAMKNTAIIGAAAIAAGIAALSVVVVGLGSDFEQANAKASTLFGNAQVDMTAYQGKMLDLSSKTGLAATDLGNTMYDALSAGIPASDDMSEAIGYLEKNTKLAKAGFTDINTATTATAKVLNAYKMNVGETDRVHKVLMATQNRGITTVNELGSVLSQVTPTASAMSVSFEQVGASLANMTAQGTPTAQATTQLNQLFAELGKKGTIGQEGLEKAIAGTKHAGKSFQDLMKEGVPLNEILDLMGTYAEKNGLSLLDMFSSLDGGKAALALSGQNAEQFTSNLKEMSTEVDLVGDAYDKVTDTFQEKSKKVVNSLKNVGIQAYSKFEVPLKGAMDSAQKSVDSLAREMSSGKLSKSVDTIADGFADLIKVTVDIAEDALPAIINGFAFLVDHGKEVTVTLAAISGAMVGMKFLPMIQSFIKAKAAVEAYNVGLIASTLAGKTFAGSMTLGQVAVGLLTGQVTLATAAHTAWNAAKALDPTMMVVIAVGALVAGITALCFSMNEEQAEHKKTMDEIESEIEAREDLKAQQAEQLSANLGEITNLQSLNQELSNLVDANGKVKEGYEARAKFILGEMNSALGLNMELTNGEITGYKDLSISIDNMIAKKRAEIILESQLPAYKEAVTKAIEAQTKANEIGAEITKNNTEATKLEMELVSKYGENWKKNYEAIASEQGQALTRLKIDTATKQTEYDAQNELVNGYYSDISSYETNATLIASGNAVEYAKVQTDVLAAKQETVQGQIQASTDQITADQQYLDFLKTTYEKETDESKKNAIKAQIDAKEASIRTEQEKIDGLTATIINKGPEYDTEVKRLAMEALQSFSGDTQEYFGVSRNKLDSVINGLNSKDPEVKAKAEEEAQTMLDGLRSKDDEYSKAGANVIDGVLSGSNSKAGNLFSTMADYGSRMLESFKDSLGIKSPSKKFAELSKYIPEGIKKGIDENKGNALSAIDDLSNDLTKRFQGISNFEVDDLFNKLNSGYQAISSVIPSSAKVSVEEELQKVKLLFGNTKNDSAPKQDVTINQTVQFMDKTESPSSVYRALQRATKKMANLY